MAEAEALRRPRLLPAGLILALALAPTSGQTREDSPAFALGKSIAESAALIGAEALWGPGPVYAYKTWDFMVDVGDAGVEEEDRTLGAQLVMVGEAGRRLKDLKAQGRDLRTDPQAIQAKLALNALRTGMSSGEDGLGYVAYAIGRNPEYAFGRPALGLVLGEAVGHVLDRLGLDKLLKRVLPADALARLTPGNRAPYARPLRFLGWGKMAARKAAAEALKREAVDAAVEQRLEAALDAAELATRQALYDKALEAAPPRPVVHNDAERLQAARAVLPPVAATPIVVPMAAQAVPIPVHALPPPPARAAPLAVNLYVDPRYFEQALARDPVRRVIQAEDRWTPPSREPASQPEPQAAPPPPEPPSPARSRWKHDWDCAGAGVKAGCDWPPGKDNSWDGQRGKTLND
jgi:hypothetical protein